MNTITREIIERELEDIQECHTRAIEQVERAQGQLRAAERYRDECANQIGALKEDLAHSENAPWEKLAAELGRSRSTR